MKASLTCLRVWFYNGKPFISIKIYYHTKLYEEILFFFVFKNHEIRFKHKNLCLEYHKKASSLTRSQVVSADIIIIMEL